MKKEKTVKVVVLTNEKRPELPDTKFGKKVELPVEVAATLVSQGYVEYEK